MALVSVRRRVLLVAEVRVLSQALSKVKVLGIAVVTVLLCARTASTAPIMFVHDSVGTLGTVDVANGAVSVIGTMGVLLTDIGFDPSGALYGVSFTDFYSINPLTAATTLIGSLGVGAGMNALVFGTDGTAYAAGFLSTNLYTINTSNGLATSLGNISAASAGDLAFNAGNLYLATLTDTLHLINLSNLAASTTVGPFGVPFVFGLATGDNGQLYAVAGTQVYTVNTATGAATNPVNFGSQGLSTAQGESFFTEAGAPPVVPEPSTLILLGSGLAARSAWKWRSTRKGQRRRSSADSRRSN